MDTRESAPAVRNHRPTGDDTMQMATTLRRSTHTFLTHLFGPGLDDDRYVIERFQSKADGEIRPRRRNGSSKKSRGKASREIVSLSTVQRLRSGEGRPADLWLPVAGGTSPGAGRLAPLAPALREQARRRRSPILNAGTGDRHAGAYDDLVPLGPHALHGAE